MKYDFSELEITHDGSSPATKAAGLFSAEILSRTSLKPDILSDSSVPTESRPRVHFCTDSSLSNKDSYIIGLTGKALTICAAGIRGLIFGYSLFLRKTVYDFQSITLIKDISGEYSPRYSIRGHQCGYRTTPNTYDAWNYEQYGRYYLDIMAFGCNTVEHIPYETSKSHRNSLMLYDEEEFLVKASKMADDLDLDVSLWFPNSDDETEGEALAHREKLFKSLPRIDAVFPPGGDPGEIYADEFCERCKKIAKILRKYHPDAKMWPSAQAPHIYPDWGEALTEELTKNSDEIDGLIMGPNHAFPLHELRKRIPQNIPMRFYPDITHNVRCEYPVHFQEDDWHFALASTLSRESVNPRPTEFRTLHKLCSPYMIGSVSYSEGVHDDLNKMVWSAMDFEPDIPLREAVSDYVRFFLYGADCEKITDGIFMLEMNWQGDPLENGGIDATYRLFKDIKAQYPFLCKNWRFMLLYFRACCDRLVRQRRLFETEMVDEAKHQLLNGSLETAKNALMLPYPDDYNDLHDEIFSLGQILFDLIGIQLDVEHFHTNNWERGATLDTIDRPVTDRLWLLNRIEYISSLPVSEQKGAVNRLLNRNKVKLGEYYWSLSLHGLSVLGERQQGEFYMDFQGDRPKVNNGTIPMSMLKVYDHHSFRCRLGGFLPKTDYTLTVIYKTRQIDLIRHHRIMAFDTVIYDGKQYGGNPDTEFDRELLAPGFESASYQLPAGVFKNTTLELLIEEPISGFEITEFFIKMT